MLSLFDAPSLERALSIPIDGHLRQLLGQRVDHLNHLDFDVRESTYFLVIDASCTIDDVTDELGWSPMINPLDGQHWGSPTFQPYHDYLRDHEGWFEMLVSAGNDAMFVLLIEDDDRGPADLLTLCRRYT